MLEIEELFSISEERQYAKAVMEACKDNLHPYAALVDVDPSYPLPLVSDANRVLGVLVDEGMLRCERWENSDIYGAEEVPGSQRVFFGTQV